MVQAELDAPGNGEGASCLGLPDVLLVIVVLCDDGDAVRYKIGTVESHSKLANHGDVRASAQGLHECLQRRTLGVTHINF